MPQHYARINRLLLSEASDRIRRSDGSRDFRDVRIGGILSQNLFSELATLLQPLFFREIFRTVYMTKSRKVQSKKFFRALN